jgi:hypothetical protein
MVRRKTLTCSQCWKSSSRRCYQSQRFWLALHLLDSSRTTWHHIHRSIRVLLA